MSVRILNGKQQKPALADSRRNWKPPLEDWRNWGLVVRSNFKKPHSRSCLEAEFLLTEHKARIVCSLNTASMGGWVLWLATATQELNLTISVPLSVHTTTWGEQKVWAFRMLLFSGTVQTLVPDGKVKSSLCWPGEGPGSKRTACAMLLLFQFEPQSYGMSSLACHQGTPLFCHPPWGQPQPGRGRCKLSFSRARIMSPLLSPAGCVSWSWQGRR